MNGASRNSGGRPGVIPWPATRAARGPRKRSGGLPDALGADRSGPAPVPWPGATELSVGRYGRFWAVYDGNGALVCVTVYRKGAVEVARRLSQREA